MKLSRNLVFVALIIGCGPAKRDNNGDDAPLDAAVDAPCITALTGKVFAPNGTLPLSNVTVYVPFTQPPELPAGVQCDVCSDPPGQAIVKTTTDAEGKFRLEGLPLGVGGIQVAVHTGKWLRTVILPPPGLCVDNAVPDGMLRLPKNKSEGQMPHVAMVTGGFDSLACLFPKLGIDASEFGSDSNGPKAFTFYNGSGGSAPGTPQPAAALWGNLDEMKKFDMVINSCEGSINHANKTAPDLLRQYADLGGRVFGSHYHYTWSKDLIPQWQGTATWTSASTTSPDLVDTTHPGGTALAQWLVAVGASSTPGQVTLNDKIGNVTTVNPPTTRWLYSGAGTATHYLSFKTPVGAMPENQCGKVVYAGMHVSLSGNSVNANFPAGCSAGLSPDEKALVYLLFDLGACVNPIF